MAIDIKKILSDTVIELSLKKPLAKITINDLIVSSGVSRQTFYNHFSDKFDLINWTYSSRVMSPWDKINKDFPYYSYVINANKESMKLQKFFMQACNLVGQNSLTEYMLEYSINWFTNYIVHNYGKSVLTEELRFAIEFNAFASINMHFKWILAECPVSPEDKARYTIACIPNIIKKYLPINE